MPLDQYVLDDVADEEEKPSKPVAKPVPRKSSPDDFGFGAGVGEAEALPPKQTGPYKPPFLTLGW